MGEFLVIVAGLLVGFLVMGTLVLMMLKVIYELVKEMVNNQK